MLHVMKQMQTVRLLMARDWFVLKKDAFSLFIDALIHMICNLFVMSQLLPLVGLEAHMIPSLYLGSVTMLLFSLGFNLSLTHVFDLSYDRFIDYQLTLPVHIYLLIAQQVFSYMMRACCIVLPVILLGVAALHGYFSWSDINIIAAICITFMSMLFTSLFFMAISFRYEFTWYVDNAWPRRLSPLFLLGTVFITWKKAYAAYPWLGSIMLFNPFTYITEGFRAALLGGHEYIPVLYCMLALGIASGLCMLAITYALKKRLDPVI